MPLSLLGRRRALSRLAVGVGATALLATPLATTVAVSSAATATSTASSPTPSQVRMSRLHHVASKAERAKSALSRAELALSPSTPAAKRPDATMALRKLWLLRGALSPSDRAAADALSKRPKADSLDCTSAIACVHWTAGAVAPTWPGTVRDVINYVGTTYRNAGYRATLPDGTLGGGPQTDIYITDLPQGLYGYCTTDQKRLSAPGHYNVWAFCVLDDDYSEFPLHTPLENLEVTAAHEFYHATQFAYDAADDGWFLESTAAFMEDELYTNVNDNLQYLRDSPITHPGRSIDKFGGVFHYGVWNFWRYLAEKYPTLQGGLPQLLLTTWEYADSSKGPRKDLYSVQALNKALRKLDHTTLAQEFAYYSDATRRTHSVFSEGAADNYPSKKLEGEKKLGKKHASKRYATKLDHLTSATYRFDSAGLKKKSKLKLHFDMAPKSQGSEAVVSVYKTDGSLKTKLVKLNRAGKATKSLKFGSDKVVAIEVTLVNASTRYRACFQDKTPFSCSGVPVAENRTEAVTGTVV